MRLRSQKQFKSNCPGRDFHPGNKLSRLPACGGSVEVGKAKDMRSASFLHHLGAQAKAMAAKPDRVAPAGAGGAPVRHQPTSRLLLTRGAHSSHGYCNKA
jgi:hypothetical protein